MKIVGREGRFELGKGTYMELTFCYACLNGRVSALWLHSTILYCLDSVLFASQWLVALIFLLFLLY